MLHLAYDGSTHNDWIAPYAVHLAAASPERALSIVCVVQPQDDRASLERRLDWVEQRCAALDVACTRTVVQQYSVLAALKEAVPRGPDHVLVCGTRVAERDHGYLTGTVTAQLLREPPCNVLAVRVVQPGLQGQPHELLLPASGHPRGLRAALPFLRLFAPEIHTLRLLLVKEVAWGRFRHLPHEQAQRLRDEGRRYLRRLREEIAQEPRLAACRVVSEAVVSDDVPKEILLAANRTRSELLFLGASERTLPQRFVYGNPIEQILRQAPCDVAIYRGAE